MGLASSILFAYPIFTAAIMVLGFGERLRWHTAVACPLALAGILALSLGGGDYRVSPLGIFLELLSAVFMAVSAKRIGSTPTAILLAVSLIVSPKKE